jgi:peptidoglycan/xylan/chitin deacetylase (PgdA/CDA1 family)
VDSLDWKEYGVEDEINRVLNHKALGNGSIILFHNDAKYTPDALDSIIKSLKEKGYEIVPISELIYKDNYYMNHEGRQIKNTEEATQSGDKT